MLIPSTATALRTRRYTSTLYIHPTIHRLNFKPIEAANGPVCNRHVSATTRPRGPLYLRRLHHQLVRERKRVRTPLHVNSQRRHDGARCRHCLRLRISRGLRGRQPVLVRGARQRPGSAGRNLPTVAVRPDRHRYNRGIRPGDRQPLWQPRPPGNTVRREQHRHREVIHGDRPQRRQLGVVEEWRRQRPVPAEPAESSGSVHRRISRCRRTRARTTPTKSPSG